MVYQVHCSKCNASYISETGCALYCRLHEHDVDKESAVNQHHENTSHAIDCYSTRVLDRETNVFRRGVKEAIQIRRQDPPLNRDRGRYGLPAIYNPLVHSRGRSVITQRLSNRISRGHVTHRPRQALQQPAITG